MTMAEQKDSNNKSARIPAWLSTSSWILIIIALSTAFWVLRDVRVNKILETKDLKISEVILKSLKFHVDNDAIIPETLIVSFDTITKSQINDSLVTYLKNVLLERYLDTDSTIKNKAIQTPYFLFPTNKDKDGSYKLTERQLSEFKQNILFLTNQVDKAVSEAKNEISNSIDKLNMWVSIWIGVIGFLGIFIPILLNYQTSKNIDKELENAISKAEKAENKIDAAEPTLDKVDGIEAKLTTLEENINTAISESNKAKEGAISAKNDSNAASQTAKEAKKRIDDAEPILLKVDEIDEKAKALEENISEALKNSSVAKEEAIQAKNNANEALSKSEDAIKNSKAIDNLLITTNSISKLKNIDSSRLIHVTDKIGHLVKTLESVHKSMKACAENFSHNIVVDSFQELIISLYSISKFDFIDHTSIENITKFIISVNGSLEAEWTIEKFKFNMISLEELIANLKT